METSMLASPSTRKSRVGINLVALAVVATLLTLVAPATTAQAASNKPNLTSCLGTGWKSLQASDGKAMPSEAACLVYAIFGGQLQRKQTVAFTSTAPVPSVVGHTYRPTAAATSDLPAAITLDSTSHGCTIAAGLVTFTAVGTCVIDADQAGNSVYGKAPRVKQPITVVKASQTITFTSAVPSPALVEATYQPSATSSSGLAVAITKDAVSTGCSIADGVVTFTGAGTCVIDGNQAGNAGFAAAVQVQQSFTVTAPAPPVDEAPAAVADSFTVSRFSGPTAIDVLTNDTDTDGGPKTIASVTQPDHGTVAIAADGKSLTYEPADSYCNSDQTASLSPDVFTYTLSGGSSAAVSVKVSAPHQKPQLAPGTFMTQKNGAATVRNITQLGNGGQNIVGNALPTIFSGTNVIDAGSCTSGTLKYHWEIVYPNRPGTYTVAGIIGYATPTLTIARNSMLNEPAGAVFTLIVTSSVTGLDETYPIVAIVSGSILTTTVYNQCQGVLVGQPCSNPNAKPAGPSDIALSNTDVTENSPSGTIVGTLTAPDPDPQPSQSYILASGAGDDDNGSFTIDGNTLKTAASFDFETKATYSVRIRVKSSAGFIYDKVLTINVTDVDDSGTA
jgi:hypothetical protein